MEQSEHGSDGNDGVHHIPLRSSITGASPSNCLVSYWTLVEEVLPLFRDAVGVFCSPSRLAQNRLLADVYIFDSIRSTTGLR